MTCRAASCATAPPHRPVLPPCGTSARSSCAQARTSADTAAVSCGSATASAAPRYRPRCSARYGAMASGIGAPVAARRGRQARQQTGPISPVHGIRAAAPFTRHPAHVDLAAAVHVEGHGRGAGAPGQRLGVQIAVVQGVQRAQRELRPGADRVVLLERGHAGVGRHEENAAAVDQQERGVQIAERRAFLLVLALVVDQRIALVQRLPEGLEKPEHVALGVQLGRPLAGQEIVQDVRVQPPAAGGQVIAAHGQDFLRAVVGDRRPVVAEIVLRVGGDHDLATLAHGNGYGHGSTS